MNVITEDKALLRKPTCETKPRNVLELGGGTRLSCEAIERFANDPSMTAAYSAEARHQMAASCETLARARDRGDEIYGLTTGFGPHVKYSASSCADEQGAGLIAHLGAGFGSPASREVVVATMLVRAQTLAAGMSGVALNAADALLSLLNARVVPIIPEVGSVGASGDLIPLSFIARVLMGDGEALVAGERVSGREALRRAGLKPLSLSGRDALALVNGTAFMCGYAALAVARAQRLIEWGERITGWAYRVLGCRAQALDARLHRARGHEGQIASAAAILQEAGSCGPWEDATRPLQEVYSLRCAPQFLGACRDQIKHARMLIEREINGVNDNPVVWSGDRGPADEAVLHGGNFQGQQIAFAADTLNAAIVQAAVLAERQIDVLVNPELNGAAPLLLAWQPGATSGMAGAQITATALVAEMRHHGNPVATSSIPTNGRNQDVVSMGTLASRAALGQTPRLAGVLSILGMCADQLTHLRVEGRASGPIAQRPTWMPTFAGFESDRPLFADIDRLVNSMLTAA
jgi:tyrosine ammonia-lyase